MGIFTSGYRIICDGKIPLGYTGYYANKEYSTKDCTNEIADGSKTAKIAMVEAIKNGWKKRRNGIWYCPECLKRSIELLGE